VPLPAGEHSLFESALAQAVLPPLRTLRACPVHCQSSTTLLSLLDAAVGASALQHLAITLYANQDSHTCEQVAALSERLQKLLQLPQPPRDAHAPGTNPHAAQLTKLDVAFASHMTRSEAPSLQYGLRSLPPLQRARPHAALSHARALEHRWPPLPAVHECDAADTVTALHLSGEWHSSGADAAGRVAQLAACGRLRAWRS
jgi:hypothetical protein